MAPTVPAERQPVVRRLMPCAITMTFPVNSSAPAKTTRVSATPKTAPWTSLVIGEPAAASGAETLTRSPTAIPT